LKDVRDVPTWSMPSGEAVDALLGITRLRGQLADLEARVIDRVDQAGVAMDAGASSTANWLAVQTRQTRTGAPAAGLEPSGFSFEASLMIVLISKPSSRATSSIGLPGSYTGWLRTEERARSAYVN
jgi:hypothetical protein